MKKRVFTAVALTAGIRLVLAADPAALSIVVFDEGQPAADTEVVVDGKPVGRTDEYGSLRLTIPAGNREVVLRAQGREVLRLPLEFVEGENAELIASLQPDASAHVQYESSEAGRPTQQQLQAETPAGPPGTLTGRVVSSEGGTPVANARVFISGTPLDIRTDGDGRFAADVPSGSYSVSVIAADFDTRTIDGVEIAAEQTTIRDLEITPAGLELPEFVVLEPYIEGSLASLVEERRESAQVLDLLGAEQISRAGDSDAAGALKRVTGLTLVDGKFIFVRGLGERYSSTLLNGAQIPSPDPTRRVVPLDLFPTEVLEGIGVQKTYSADMPGEFGGGTVQLRTKSYPRDFRMKVSASVGYEEGTTGEDGLTYRGGGNDWLGRDDGVREMPRELMEGQIGSLSASDRERVAEALASKGYRQYERKVDPNGTFAIGIGDSFGSDDVRFGYTASLRHAHQWDDRWESLRKFSINGQGTLNPSPIESYELHRTERAIDNSVYLATGASFYENHHVNAGFLQLRQTTDDVRFREGYDTSPSDITRDYTLEWIENELLVKQFSGEHRFPSLSDLLFNWQFTHSDVARFEPNTRRYEHETRPGHAEFGLTRGSQGNSQLVAHLDDQAEEGTVGFSLPFELGSDWDVTLHTGYGTLERQRDSRIRRYRFRIGNSPLLTPLGDIEEIFSPIYISATDNSLVTLIDNTAATDTYRAEQELDSAYLAADVAYDENYRLNVGVRREANFQKVTTFQPFLPGAVPDVAMIDEVDYLPAATFTWAYGDSAQFRIGYSKTLSRPDFRELTKSPFTDPLTDVTTQGNPELQQAEITNYDLRWEYYFSDTEILSLALFMKQFDNPIEIVRVPGTGELREPQNAEEATNYGFEIDYYKSLSDLRRWDWFDRSWFGRIPWEDVYVGFNYARIKSEITLGESVIGIQTTDNRPLQGQSPYVLNFQIGYQDPDGEREAILLYNVFGERIVGVGVRTLPDIHEQPLRQLDFVYSEKLRDNWKFKLRLRNLLGEHVEYTQGSRTSRSYDKGRDITLSLEWSW